MDTFVTLRVPERILFTNLLDIFAVLDMQYRGRKSMADGYFEVTANVSCENLVPAKSLLKEQCIEVLP